MHRFTYLTGNPYLFLCFSSSWVNLRLHTENKFKLEIGEVSVQGGLSYSQFQTPAVKWIGGANAEYNATLVSVDVQTNVSLIMVETG